MSRLAFGGYAGGGRISVMARSQRLERTATAGRGRRIDGFSACPTTCSGSP